MRELAEFLLTIVRSLDVRAVVDIVIVTGIAYWLLSLIQGTTAATLLRGIVLVFLVGSVASNVLGLTMLGWLLRNAVPALLVAIPILFQPELRRALEGIGRAGIMGIGGAAAANQHAIDTVSVAAGRLAERSWGALIVLERGTRLGEYADTGVKLDSALSVELLLSIFYPHSPLHDGAVIVRGDRIVAAGCFLPLAETIETGHQFGTRHRAAIGITEKSDALSIVVSEERGEVSICNKGRIVRGLGEQQLKHMLPMLYRTVASEPLTLPNVFRLRTQSRIS
jgi:uncharacterized protein (TIGR00159 family)